MDYKLFKSILVCNTLSILLFWYDKYITYHIWDNWISSFFFLSYQLKFSSFLEIHKYVEHYNSIEILNYMGIIKISLLINIFEKKKKKKKNCIFTVTIRLKKAS